MFPALQKITELFLFAATVQFKSRFAVCIWSVFDIERKDDLHIS
jgi:hypothetical protein